MNLKLLSKGNVLVFGDIILDRYISGSVDRVSPEAPVPVLKPSDEDIRLGGAANVAVNLSSLGSKVTLIGVTGKDVSSDQVRVLLEQNKIRNALSKSVNPTISKLRFLAGQQQLIRIDSEEEFTEADWKSSLSNYKKHIRLEKNKVLVISDYEKGTLKNIPLIIKEAKKLNKIILVDPKGDDFSKYKSANIITPNFDEFVRVVGNIKGEANVTSKGKELIHSLKLSALLITRGSEGMTLLENKKGKIINITSVVGHTGNLGQANYTASKAGIIAMSKSLAIEYAKKNINVNCISPGFIKTAMTDKIDEKFKDIITSKIPSGRLGDPDDVANAVLFLCSNQSNYINGETLHVNGGMYMA